MDYQEQVSQAYQLYQQGQRETALFMLRKIVGQSPTEAVAWWGIAVVSKDPAEKRRAVERVLILSPEHRGARKMLARLNNPASSALPAPARQSKARARRSQTGLQPQDQLWVWAILALLVLIFLATVLIGGGMLYFILSNQPAV